MWPARDLDMDLMVSFRRNVRLYHFSFNKNLDFEDVDSWMYALVKEVFFDHVHRAALNAAFRSLPTPSVT